MPASMAFRSWIGPLRHWGPHSAHVLRHHRWWAPGVWLMRRLSLSQKALMALLAVALPLVPLHIQVMREWHASALHLQVEVLGLGLLEDAERVVHEVSTTRHAADDWADHLHEQVLQLKSLGVDASPQESGLKAAVAGLLLGQARADSDAVAQDALRMQSEWVDLLIHQGDWGGDPHGAYRKHALYQRLHAALHQQAGHDTRVNLLSDLRAIVVAQRDQVSERLSGLAAVLAVSALVGGYFLVSAYRVLRGGLAHVTACVQRLKEGDLCQPSLALGHDELGHIIDDLGVASLKLADLLASAGMGVQAVSHASQQVAVGNADLASRNRASTDKVASAVEGVVHYTLRLEDCRSEVQSVVKVVDALMLESVRSRHQMGKLVETMSTLTERSNEIGEIVSLIDGIAFRTNVLALNASVEANKAGELGKGFAVVAHEVRSLALKAAHSAQRIGSVVHASTEDIALGTALAKEADKQLGCMDAHVGQIKQASARVAGMTKEGEAESENILEELRHIKAGMDQNLKLVDQLSEASGALSMQSERLQIKLAQFKLT